jgi:hypothetical protein
VLTNTTTRHPDKNGGTVIMAVLVSMLLNHLFFVIDVAAN